MITNLKTFETDYIDNLMDTQNDIQFDNQVDTQTEPKTDSEIEPGFPFGRKIIILESNWDIENTFNNISVYPFLSNISPILGNKHPIQVGHRNFDSLRGLKFYTQFPSGKIWNDPSCWGTSVFYIGSHGGTTSILPTMDVIRQTGMIDSFKGFESYPNIIYFGGCGIFNGEKGDNFGWDLVGSSGTRCVVGFKSHDVGFLDSIVIDILFLTRFFGVDDSFNRLTEIYESILYDFPPSRDLGFSMYLR